MVGAGHTCVIVVPLPVCVCCVQVVEMSWLRRSADDKVQKRAEGVGGEAGRDRRVDVLGVHVFCSLIVS